MGNTASIESTSNSNASINGGLLCGKFIEFEPCKCINSRQWDKCVVTSIAWQLSNIQEKVSETLSHSSILVVCRCDHSEETVITFEFHDGGKEWNVGAYTNILKYYRWMDEPNESSKTIKGVMKHFNDIKKYGFDYSWDDYNCHAFAQTLFEKLTSIKVKRPDFTFNNTMKTANKYAYDAKCILDFVKHKLTFTDDDDLEFSKFKQATNFCDCKWNKCKVTNLKWQLLQNKNELHSCILVVFNCKHCEDSTITLEFKDKTTICRYGGYTEVAQIWDSNYPNKSSWTMQGVMKHYNDINEYGFGYNSHIFAKKLYFKLCGVDKKRPDLVGKKT